MLENCPHTLVSGGKLAAEDGVGTWLAPYDQVSYLRPQANNELTDIPLLNVGVLVIPARSVDASAYAAVSAPQVRNGRGNGRADGDLVHTTFNHRNLDALRRMPQFTNAPAAWADVKASDTPCDDCLRGVCKRVTSKEHVPDYGAPGHISIDGWQNKTAHEHGGQRLVLPGPT